MTETEFQEQILPAIPQFWDRYRIPPGKVRGLWERLSRYPAGAVVYEMRRVAREDLDSPRPNWQVITDRLSSDTHRAPADGWSISDEHRAAWIEQDYIDQGKTPPSVEYIATHHMGKSYGPSEQERRRAAEAIRALYPSSNDDANFSPTIAGIRARQDDHIRMFTELQSKLTTVHRPKWQREPSRADAEREGRASYEMFLDAMKGNKT